MRGPVSKNAGQPEGINQHDFRKSKSFNLDTTCHYILFIYKKLRSRNFPAPELSPLIRILTAMVFPDRTVTIAYANSY